MRVIFPIDYRYGWDIGFAPHQKLLEKVRDALKPKIWFWARVGSFLVIVQR